MNQMKRLADPIHTSDDRDDYCEHRYDKVAASGSVPNNCCHDQ